MRHFSRVSQQRPALAGSILPPTYPPGLLGVLMRIRDAVKGIEY